MDIINKAVWAQKDGDINITLPFKKIDQSQRTVSGFATMDNVDSHDDIVTAEASLKAFATFRGNVREMHQPIAVGKVIEFTPETYYDQKSDKFYTGVYVTTRVSAGAQDTWEKVLDGTLSGFSIGGKVLDAEVVWNQELEKNIQVIKDMELFELSLVDNPANPLANVVSIQKTVEHQTPVTEHVFTCTDCKTTISSMADARECPTCDTQMTDIGFIERRSTVNKEIKKMVSDYEASIAKSEDAALVDHPLPETDTIISEGDITMDEIQEPVAEETTDAVDEVTEEVTEEVVETATVEADAGADEVEESVDEPVADKTAADFESIVTALADLKTYMDEVLATHAAQAKEAAQEATAAVAKSVDEQIKTLRDEFTASLDAVKGTVGEVEKRVDTVEDSTAVKKSGDLGGESANIKKSVWDGSFLGISTLDKD